MLAVVLAVGRWDFLTVDESGSSAIRQTVLLVAAVTALPLTVWRNIVAHKQYETARHSLLNERYQRAVRRDLIPAIHLKNRDFLSDE